MSGIPAGAGSLLGKRLGKYEILALLALGGTAEIYLARIGGAAGFEKYVVVKCLHDHLADDMEFVKMFLDEARLAAHLDHSNIVQTMELGEHESRYYMVMEFLGGLSLAMVVRRVPERLPNGQMPMAMAINIVAQAAAGLHYAHERTVNGKVLNIVHRDISPQNLVISFEGVVKVVDFGIAKAEMRETRTRSGTIKGKFAYMSPEQCVANNVDRRTDIFALGVIAHELLTGGRLFKRNSPYETYQAVIDCNVPPPSKLNPSLDAELDGIIMRALAKEKEGRYPTAEAFGDALLGYLHHRGKGSGPNDVSRFFEASFNQEIEEHGARMRELIEGRADSVDTGVKWDSEEEERERVRVERERERKRSDETVDLSGRGASQEDSISLATGDIELGHVKRDSQAMANRGSQGSLTHALDNLDLGDGGGDDDMPPDRTRIETNPLEKVEQMRPTPVPAAIRPKPKMPPSGPLPLPPAPTGPVPAATVVAPMPPVSGKFPDMANMQTQIAADLPDPAPPRAVRPTAPEYARTELGAEIVDPSRDRTQEASAYTSPAANERTRVAAAPYQGQAATQPQQNYPASVEVRPSLFHGTPAMTRPTAQPMPASYPMLDAQMAAEVPARAQNSAQVQAALARAPEPQPQQQPQYPVRQVESGVFVSGPTMPPQQVAPPSGPYDAHRAANMMSPVGAGYPSQDWDAAAAKPAKAVPKWMFAVLFVAGFGLALLLTVAIAKAVH